MFDRVAPPAVDVLVAVVGGLFSGKSFHSGVGGSDGTRGIACGMLPAAQPVLERRVVRCVRAA